MPQIFSKKKKVVVKKDGNKLLSIKIYGIWNKTKNKLIYVNLSLEEAELEYDMEGYSEDSYVIICLMGYYDSSGLV